jgi:predicted O-methyltransferase YrrM
MIPSRNKITKIAAILGGIPRHRQVINAAASRAYNGIMLKDSPIKSVSALAFLGEKVSVCLENFISVDGNVTLDELVFICALARKLKARRIVEIGTFDGNTALQLALNTGDEARIFTLDLPVGARAIYENDEHDLRYVASERRIKRRFVGTAVEGKITQCYGNSLEYDFAKFTDGGKPDYIFIDAGHSYECVRNDSQKSLSVLAEGGVIVWQDYGTTWPGVYQYLVELSAARKLTHIADTSLVVFSAA